MGFFALNGSRRTAEGSASYRDEVAERALACELRAGAGISHHHLSDGFSSADDRIYDPRDASKTILVGQESGLDSSRKARRAARLGKLERHELLDASTF